MKRSEEQNPNYDLVLYVQGMRRGEEQDPSLSYAYMNYPLTRKRAVYAKNKNWGRPKPEILFSRPPPPLTYERVVHATNDKRTRPRLELLFSRLYKLPAHLYADNAYKK
jgi:hypothetical protein